MIKKADSVGSALIGAITSAGGSNLSISDSNIALIWPDKERQWVTTLPALLESLPSLVHLGDYELGLRRGPSIWLKCVVSGLAPEFELCGIRERRLT